MFGCDISVDPTNRRVASVPFLGGSDDLANTCVVADYDVFFVDETDISEPAMELDCVPLDIRRDRDDTSEQLYLPRDQ